MSVHYRVSSRFVFTQGKARLVSVSLNSTTQGCTLWPCWDYSIIDSYQIFPSLMAANTYIEWLFNTHPYTAATRPALDADQPLLF